MKEDMIKILNIPYDSCPDKQLLGYDTTFEFGDFFISTITIRDIRFHTDFERFPILPTFTIFHERKL